MTEQKTRREALGVKGAEVFAEDRPSEDGPLCPIQGGRVLDADAELRYAQNAKPLGTGSGHNA